MTATITLDELNAKIEALEARLDEVEANHKATKAAYRAGNAPQRAVLLSNWDVECAYEDLNRACFLREDLRARQSAQAVAA